MDAEPGSHTEDPTAAVKAELSSLLVRIQAIDKTIDRLAEYPTEVDKAVANVKAQVDERLRGIEEHIADLNNAKTAIEVSKVDIRLLREEIIAHSEAQKEALSLALASIDKATVIAQQTADRAVAKAEAAASQTLLESMIAAIRDNFGGQIQNLKDSLTQAMNAAEKAVAKAENANEKRFEGVNEFRAQMADQAQRFMPRLEAEGLVRSTSEKVDALGSRLDKIEGRTAGVASSGAIAAGAIGVVGTVVMSAIAIMAFSQ